MTAFIKMFQLWKQMCWELHAFARAVDAQIVFRIRLTNHLITES